jgi:hypothetical protein
MPVHFPLPYLSSRNLEEISGIPVLSQVELSIRHFASSPGLEDILLAERFRKDK